MEWSSGEGFKKGRKTKGRKRGVEALRGVSVTSTLKVLVLQSHYQRLGSCSVDEANWKQEVDSECHWCSLKHDNCAVMVRNGFQGNKERSLTPSLPWKDD